MLNKLKQLFLWGMVFVPIASAYSYKGIDIHGFWGQGYLATTHNNYFENTKDGTARFSEAAINLSTWLNDKTRIGAQAYTFRLGDIGSMKDPMVDWAYIDYQHSDRFGVRAGRVKIASGLYNESLDLDASRPYVFLPQGIYNALWRDFSSSLYGIGAYGNVSLGDMGSVDYSVQAGEIRVGSESGFLWSFSDSSFSQMNDTKNDIALVTHATWNTPLVGLKVVASGIYVHDLKFRGKFKTAAELSNMPGPNSGFAGLASTVAGADVLLTMRDIVSMSIGAEYLYDAWTFAAEYNRIDRSTSTVVEHAAASGVSALNGSLLTKVTSDAMYAGASYRVNDRLELGGYYSLSFTDVDDRDGSNLAANGGLSYDAYQKDLTLSARYDITDNWLIKAEAHYINGVSLIDYKNNQPWEDLDDRWFMFALKTTYYF